MTDTKITVTRTIPASAQEIFDYLTLPANHVEMDGSGMVRSVDHGDRISEVGQVFTMNMFAEAMGGDYQMENHVSAFAKNQLVGWKPAQKGQEPGGWEWLYELDGQGDSTEVTLTYDWSGVTDEKLKGKFPAIPKDKLEESLNLLAAGVSGK